MHWLLTVILLLSGALVSWTYLGYPLAIALLARLRPRPHLRAPFEPSVTLVIPAYNEGDVIRSKLENALLLDYPQDRLEVIVVADGSADDTAEIVEEFAGYGVQLLYRPEREGKTAAMNRAVLYARNDVLVFSDANAMMEPDGIRQVAAGFADPHVACVGGVKRIHREGPIQAEGESTYWRYEAFIKRAESLAGNAIGAIGEFMAIRRELYRPLETDSLVEDFVLSMRLVMEGWRVVYAPGAVTWETASPSLRREWNRHARMAAGGFQALGRLRSLLSPRYGLAAFQYISHKVLRWLAPLLMLVALLANALLLSHHVLRWVFWFQVLFYGSALLGWALELLGVRLRPLRVVFYFVFGNLAILAGFIRFVTRSQSVLWDKVR